MKRIALFLVLGSLAIPVVSWGSMVPSTPWEPLEHGTGFGENQPVVCEPSSVQVRHHRHDLDFAVVKPSRKVIVGHGKTRVRVVIYPNRASITNIGQRSVWARINC